MPQDRQNRIFQKPEKDPKNEWLRMTDDQRSFFQ